MHLISSSILLLQLTMNDFSVHRIIGRGGFGEVYGCRKADTGKMYAMKCLDKKRIKMKQGETLALNERIMLSLVSTGVSVKYHYCIIIIIIVVVVVVVGSVMVTDHIRLMDSFCSILSIITTLHSLFTSSICHLLSASVISE